MSKKTQRERQERRRFKKLAIIALLVGLVLVGCVAALLFYVNGSGTKPEGAENDKDNQQIENDIALSKKDEALKNNAEKSIKNGDTTGADQLYQEAIDNEQVVARKIQLYIDLANAYYDSGKQDQAIETVKRAMSLSTDQFLAADWLSRAYEDRKEYTDAIKYYQIAKDSVASTQNQYNFDAGYYDRQITRVKNLQETP